MLKTGAPKTVMVIVPEMERFGFIMQKCIQKTQMEYSVDLGAVCSVCLDLFVPVLRSFMKQNLFYARNQ